MHDIWNPWHGCTKKSEGCANCYMYFLDRMRNIDSARVFRVKNNFDYPLQRNANGEYKIKSGETIRVCMTSDFFVEEADAWRAEAWEIIRRRPDVIFYLLTKRPERVAACLPANWGDGWENVFFNVTAENQTRADERLPILLSLPFKHKGVMVAPFVGRVSLAKYLESGAIERVVAGGENYDGSRVLKCEWVESLYRECVAADTTFCLIETGSRFERNLQPARQKTAQQNGVQIGILPRGADVPIQAAISTATSRTALRRNAKIRPVFRRAVCGMRKPPDMQRLLEMRKVRAEILTPFLRA